MDTMMAAVLAGTLTTFHVWALLQALSSAVRRQHGA